MKRFFVAAALAATLPWAGGALAKPAQAKDKDGPDLRWARTWAEAVAQAKDRNAVIFATFHKDH